MSCLTTPYRLKGGGLTPSLFLGRITKPHHSHGRSVVFSMSPHIRVPRAVFFSIPLEGIGPIPKAFDEVGVPTSTFPFVRVSPQGHLCYRVSTPKDEMRPLDDGPVPSLNEVLSFGLPGLVSKEPG